MYLTRDTDLGRPFGGAIQDTLLDSLHLLCMRGLGDSKDLLNQLKDLGLIALTNLHAVLQHHDDILCPVLCSVLGTFLSRSCVQARNKNDYPSENYGYAKLPPGKASVIQPNSTSVESRANATI